MKMIINGKKVDSESGLTFDVLNPATGEVIESVPKATEKDVKAAIDAAVDGQKVWAEVPVWKRAEVLYKFLDIVDANKEELAQTLCAENGKPIVEARAEIGNIKIGFSDSSNTRSIITEASFHKDRSRGRMQTCSW